MHDRDDSRRRGGRDNPREESREVGTYRVSSRSLGSVEVEAGNWLVALGEGLARLGVVSNMDRLACEVLPNATILVRDVRRGDGYVVQPIAAEIAAALEEQEDEAIESPPDGGSRATTSDLVSAVDAVLTAPGRDTAIRRALDGAVALIPAESGAIILQDRTGALSFAAAIGPEAHKLTDVVIPAGTGVAGFCVSRSTGLTVREPYADARFFKQVDNLTGYRTRSILCVPVALDHRVFGCLELLNARGGEGFASDLLNDAEVLANALAERLASPGAIGR